MKISVVVPDSGREEGVEKCLEGFAAQTISPDQFEVILISANAQSLRARFGDRLQLIVAESERVDLSAARNTAIRLATAPLVTLYSADLRPFPPLLEYCLNFHAEYPAVKHACRLGFKADASYNRLHPIPLRTATSLQSWQTFLSESITCKAGLFQYGQFDPAYASMAGPEFALRLSRRVDLTLFYEHCLAGERTEPMEFRAACEAHYMAAYDEYRLACAYPGAVVHVPAKRIDKPAELRALAATIRGMENKPAEAESPRQQMLTALYSRVEEHARAEGWAAAQTGEPPNPPGTLASLIK